MAVLFDDYRSGSSAVVSTPSSNADLETAAKFAQPKKYNVLEHIIGTTAMTPLDMIDTAAASVGLTERGEINDAVTNDLPWLHRYASENQGQIEVASGIANILLTSHIAGRVTSGAGTLASALRLIPGGKKIANMDYAWKKSLAEVRKIDRMKLAEGERGIQLLGGQRAIAATRARRLGAGRLAAQGAAAEGLIALTANQNEFLFSDEVGTNIALAALGIAVPAGIGHAISAHQIRKYANSQKYRQLLSETMDPSGFDALRDEALHLRGQTGQLVSPRDVYTDSAVAHFVSAATKTQEETQEGLNFFGKSNRNKAATQSWRLGYEESAKVTRKGIPGIDDTAFDLDTSVDVTGRNVTAADPHSLHYKLAAREDPTMPLGAMHIGKVPEGMTPSMIKEQFDEHLTTQRRWLEAVLDDPKRSARDKELAATSLRQIEEMEKGEFFILKDKELVPIDDDGLALTPFNEQIIYEQTSDYRLWRTGDGRIRIDSNGRPVIKGMRKPEIHKLDPADARAVYAVADKALRSLALEKRPTLFLPKNPTWFELDFAEELLRRTKGQARVHFPDTMTREMAMVESLAQKVDILKETGGNVAESLTLRETLNLPGLSAYERAISPVEESAFDLLINGVKNGDDIRGRPVSEIKQGLAEFRSARDMFEFSPDDFDLLGNSFHLGRDSFGNELAPLIVLKRSDAPSYFIRENLELRLANRQADLVATLTGGTAGTAVRTTAAAILSSADYLRSIRTSELADTQITSSLPGLGNKISSPATQYLDFIARDNDILLAAIRVQQIADRNFRAMFRQELEKPVTSLKRSASQVFADLRSRKNQGSSLLVNQWMAARRGWDLKPELKKVVDPKNPDRNLYTFTLADTELNRQRWLTLYGERMPKDAVLRHSDGTGEVVLDDLGKEWLEAMQHLADSARAENNTILRAQGLPELERANWYIPPENDEGFYLAFVFNSEGNVVGKLRGRTQKELDELVAREQAKPDSFVNNPGYVIRSQAEVEAFNSLFDRAQTGMMNPNIPVVQVTGRPRSGGSLTPNVNFSAWEEAILTYENQYRRLGRDTIETIYKNQIDMAKARAAAFRGDKPNKVFGSKVGENRNIHDFYLSALMGRSTIYEPRSMVGSVYESVENAANVALAKMGDYFRTVNPFTGTRAARKQFEELRNELGEHMVFKDVDDFLAQKFTGLKPPTVGSMAQSLNKFTASMVLRWLETSHAILNLTGMVNTAPAVINYFKRGVGETEEAWLKRIGHSANIVELGDGTKIPTLDMTKIAMRALNKTWNRKKHPEFDFMTLRGYLSQDVAEFQRQLATIHSHSDWRKWAKEIDKWAGFLSDRSEDFTRAYGHMVGLELAEIFGIVGREARHAFAHDVANKMIANYSPTNRPEIFQRGIGSTLGLFQSYMWNYYQRLFRYIETGDMRSAAIQYAMQNTLYGITTVPGWNEYNALMNWIQDGETNPYDGIYERFDRQTADILTTGVLSNLPVLFGQEGAALYSRGDTTVRLPGAEPFPLQAIISKAMKAVGQGIDLFRDGNPGITEQQIAEVLANFVQNRPLQGFIQSVWVGGAVDDRGNLVAREVAGSLNSIYRVMGLKPMREAQDRQIGWMNKTQNEIQLAKRKRLNRATRAIIRGGNLEKIPDVFAEYVENGGDPKYFKQWFRESLIAAQITRSEREFMEVAKDPRKMGQATRYLNHWAE